MLHARIPHVIGARALLLRILHQCVLQHASTRKYIVNFLPASRIAAGRVNNRLRLRWAHCDPTPAEPAQEVLIQHCFKIASGFLILAAIHACLARANLDLHFFAFSHHKKKETCSPKVTHRFEGAGRPGVRALNALIDMEQVSIISAFLWRAHTSTSENSRMLRPVCSHKQ